MTTNYKRVSGDAVEYEVFARKTRAEALHQVGSVVAPDTHRRTRSKEFAGAASSPSANHAA